MFNFFIKKIIYNISLFLDKENDEHQGAKNIAITLDTSALDTGKC